MQPTKQSVPTMQSASQPANQLTSQPAIKQPNSQTIKQQINQLTNSCKYRNKLVHHVVENKVLTLRTLVLRRSNITQTKD